jgi:hypothetical protein
LLLTQSSPEHGVNESLQFSQESSYFAYNDESYKGPHYASPLRRHSLDGSSSMSIQSGNRTSRSRRLSGSGSMSQTLSGGGYNETTGYFGMSVEQERSVNL